MNQHVKTRLDQAEQLFYKAKDELYKPEEDVVPYSVCQSSYHSVVNYLSGFLMNSEVEIPESLAVEELLKLCREVDSKFNDLHLAPLYKPTQSEDVWMNMDTAHDFLTMAEKTRQLVNQYN